MLDTLSAEGASAWERLMGLDGTGLSLDDRRARILSKWRGYPTATLDTIQSVADAWNIGAVVTENSFDLFQMGMSGMGDPIGGDIWAVTLVVTYPGPANAGFEASVRAVVLPTTNTLFEVT